MPAEIATAYGVCNAYSAVEIVIVTLCCKNVWLTLTLILTLKLTTQLKHHCHSWQHFLAQS